MELKEKAIKKIKKDEEIKKEITKFINDCSTRIKRISTDGYSYEILQNLIFFFGNKMFDLSSFISMYKEIFTTELIDIQFENRKTKEKDPNQLELDFSKQKRKYTKRHSKFKNVE